MGNSLAPAKHGNKQFAGRFDLQPNAMCAHDNRHYEKITGSELLLQTVRAAKQLHVVI